MKKNYQATFILDTHKWEEPMEALINQVKETIIEINGEVTEFKDLGIKTFTHAPRTEFVEGHYIMLMCTADSNFNKLLQARVRLNPNINRVIVEAIEE